MSGCAEAAVLSYVMAALPGTAAQTQHAHVHAGDQRFSGRSLLRCGMGRREGSQGLGAEIGSAGINVYLKKKQVVS